MSDPKHSEIWDGNRSFAWLRNQLDMRFSHLYDDARIKEQHDFSALETRRIETLLAVCTPEHREDVETVIGRALSTYSSRTWWLVLFLKEHTKKFLERVASLSDEGRKAWLEAKTVRIEKVDVADAHHLRYHGDVVCPGGSTRVRVITEQLDRQRESGWDDLRNEFKEGSDERKFTGVAVCVPQLRPLREYEQIGRDLDFVPWTHPEDDTPEGVAEQAEFAQYGYLFAMISQQLHLRWPKERVNEEFSRWKTILIRTKSTEESWMEYIDAFQHQHERMEIRRKRRLRGRHTPQYDLCPIFIEWMAYENAHYDNPDNFRGGTFFATCMAALDHDKPWDYLRRWARMQTSPGQLSLKLVSPQSSGSALLRMGMSGRSRSGALRTKPTARGRRGQEEYDINTPGQAWLMKNTRTADALFPQREPLVVSPRPRIALTKSMDVNHAMSARAGDTTENSVLCSRSSTVENLYPGVITATPLVTTRASASSSTVVDLNDNDAETDPQDRNATRTLPGLAEPERWACASAGDRATRMPSLFQWEESLTSPIAPLRITTLFLFFVFQRRKPMNPRCISTCTREAWTAD